MYNSFPIETETLPYGFVFKFDTLKLTGSSFKSRQEEHEQQSNEKPITFLNKNKIIIFIFFF